MQNLQSFYHDVYQAGILYVTPTPAFGGISAEVSARQTTALDNCGSGWITGDFYYFRFSPVTYAPDGAGGFIP